MASEGITLSGATLTGGEDFAPVETNQWSTPRSFRGYTAVIDYASNEYTLTITGDDAPGPATYETLRNAMNAFRTFLLDQPVTE